MRVVVCSLVASLALIVGAGLAAAAAPTDPQAGSQQILTIMRVPEAIDLLGKPLADVPVLVADTGIDLTHPDLQPRLFSLPTAVPAPDPDGVGNLGNVAVGAAGWDLLGTNAPPNLAGDADPDDPIGGSGHGTAVAGVLGAAWNNGAGGAGVAPNARFVALRTCWDGDQCYQYVQAAAIDWAAARGAKVASFSWLSGPLENGLRDAILNHPEMLFVTIPSGNGFDGDVTGDTPQPCALNAPNVLCVSTSSPTDGTDCGGWSASLVDVAVPTRNSITTLKDGSFGPTDCATSFAAPAAAGIATILFGLDPGATGADVRNAIVDSARTVPDWSGKSVSGGIVDAAAAVRLFQDRRGIATPGGGTQPPPPSPPPPPAEAGTIDVAASAVDTSSRGRFLVRFTVTSTGPANVVVVLQRALPGRKVKGVCKAPSRANRGRPACRRWVQVERRTTTSTEATQRIAVSARGRNGKRRPAGTYRVLVRSLGTDGSVSPQRVAFTGAFA
ncbi:MAG: S8 family serine peptidase [Thermoleophilia bacterium]